VDKPLKSVAHGQCDARTTVTFPAAEHRCPCDWYQRHVCEQLAQGHYLAAERPEVESATFRVASKRHNHYTTQATQCQCCHDRKLSFTFSLINILISPVDSTAMFMQVCNEETLWSPRCRQPPVRVQPGGSGVHQLGNGAVTTKLVHLLDQQVTMVSTTRRHARCTLHRSQLFLATRQPCQKPNKQTTHLTVCIQDDQGQPLSEKHSFTRILSPSLLQNEVN